MTKIICPGAVDKSLAFGSETLPDFTDVLGEWWLGSGVATGNVNRITGGATASFGSPAVSGGYATVSDDGVTPKGYTADIGALSGHAVSVLALFRPVSSAAVFPFIGPNDGMSDYSLGLPSNTTQVFAGARGWGPASDEAVVTLPDNTKFTMVMGVIFPDDTPSRIYRVVGGSSPVVTFDDGTAIPSFATTTAPLQIGGAAYSGARGAVDVAAVALADGAQGSSFASGVYERWYNYAQTLGLTVS